MAERPARERVFKTPDGPAPKRRKLTDSEDGNVPSFSLQGSQDSDSCPSSPSTPNDSRLDIPLHRSNSSSSIERGDMMECAMEAPTTPILTPTSSPRHSCPSSPCESHHSSHHVYHAKLQVVRPSTPTMLPVIPGRKRVGLVVFSKEQLPIIDALPKTPGRCAAIQSLLEAFGLLEKVETIIPAMASAKDLTAFHGEDYVEALRKTSCDSPQSDNESVEMEEDMEVYGLKDECSPFPLLWQYARLTAGATILAARYLIECDREGLVSPSPELSPRIVSNSDSSIRPPSAQAPFATSSFSPSSSRSSSPSRAANPSPTLSASNTTDVNTPTTPTDAPTPQTTPDLTRQSSRLSQHANGHSPNGAVAIHWMGGRHHAKREEASGLCFVNDAVLGLLQLANHFERVLYIDIDVHHGDGTEEAFKYSKQVLTVSCHLHEPGFYPGSGSIDEIGEGKAKYYTINVPFKEGVIDSQYTKLFDAIITSAISSYKPRAIVVVTGADCLSGDPLGGFNLTLHGVEHCIKTLLAYHLPLLILGGGGYNLQTVARQAAIITAACADAPLPDKIPPHSDLFVESSTYHTAPPHKVNHNTEEYLKMLEATVLANIQQVRTDM